MDLRRRVVGFVGEGNSKADAARRFDVSWKTVCRYVKADRGGDLAPKPHGGGRTKKFGDEGLRQMVREKPSATLKAHGKALGVSHNAIWKRLRRLEITLKKNS